MIDRRRFALLTAAEALEREPWYVMDLLADYNDSDNPITLVEILDLIREAAGDYTV